MFELRWAILGKTCNFPLIRGSVLKRIMKQVSELDEEDFDPTIAATGLPVLADFYAPWCGPCKMLSPLLEALAAKFEGRIHFLKINVDEAPELAGRFEITVVPTLLFIMNGEVRDSIVGLASPRSLISRLESMVTAGRAKYVEENSCSR